MSIKHVLSLGVGVQSSTLAFLADEEAITPTPVVGVFADTKEEPQSVYDYFEILQSRVMIPLRKIGRQESLSELALDVRTSKKTGLNYIKHQVPVFIVRENGKDGMMQRHCTLDTKIGPIRKFIRDEVVGKVEYAAWRKRHKSALKSVAESQKNKTPMDLSAWQEMQDDALACVWIGISTDEADRAKDSVVPWIVNRHPLLELNMSRKDCLDWVKSKGLPTPPKSSCSFCPYHNDDQWIWLRENEPGEFQKAIEFEKKYQQAFKQCPRLDGIPFLHASRIPLDKVEFKPGAKTDHSQAPCEGMCGL